MISSSVDLCNLALAHLGEARIVAITEDRAAARACALCFDATRDEVLRSHRWNFATGRAVATRQRDGAGVEVKPAFGWAYSYALPQQCLRVLEVNGTEDGQSNGWLVEGGAILSNDSTCNVVFIRRMESQLQLWDPLFVDALGLKLAIKLSEIIRGTTGKTDELAARYERITAPLARRVDANEGRRRKGLLPSTSKLIAARTGRA